MMMTMKRDAITIRKQFFFLLLPFRHDVHHSQCNSSTGSALNKSPLFTYSFNILSFFLLILSVFLLFLLKFLLFVTNAIKLLLFIYTQLALCKEINCNNFSTQHIESAGKDPHTPSKYFDVKFPVKNHSNNESGSIFK